MPPLASSQTLHMQSGSSVPPRPGISALFRETHAREARRRELKKGTNVTSAYFPLKQVVAVAGDARCRGESKAAAHLFLGPLCNPGLGRLNLTDVTESGYSVA
jgi:hypothetical protein